MRTYQTARGQFASMSFLGWRRRSPALGRADAESAEESAAVAARRQVSLAVRLSAANRCCRFGRGVQPLAAGCCCRSWTLCCREAAYDCVFRFAVSSACFVSGSGSGVPCSSHTRGCCFCRRALRSRFLQTYRKPACVCDCIGRATGTGRPGDCCRTSPCPVEFCPAPIADPMSPLRRPRQWSWRTQRHYRAIHHRCRRLVCHRLARTEHAAPGRLNRERVRDRRGREFFRRNRHHVSRDGPAIHERILRNRGHASTHIPVRISDVAEVVVHDHCVVNVGDSGDIHCRVGDIHAVYVPTADVITRNKHFSRSQREPCHSHAGREMKSWSRRRPNPPVRARRPGAPCSVPEPTPNRRRRKPSVHSGRVQIPRAHFRPTSSPRARPTSNFRSGRAPSPAPGRSAARPCHSRQRRTSRRTDRGLRIRSCRAKRSLPNRSDLRSGRDPAPSCRIHPGWERLPALYST